MNYLDANKFITKRNLRPATRGINSGLFWRLPKTGASRLAKITLDYFSRGKCRKCAVLSEMVNAIICV